MVLTTYGFVICILAFGIVYARPQGNNDDLFRPEEEPPVVVPESINHDDEAFNSRPHEDPSVESPDPFAPVKPETFDDSSVQTSQDSSSSDLTHPERPQEPVRPIVEFFPEPDHEADVPIDPQSHKLTTAKVWDPHADDDVNAADPTPTTKASLSTTTPTPPDADDFDCPSRFGVFPESNSCQRYWVCRDNQPTLKSCDDGQFFDKALEGKFRPCKVALGDCTKAKRQISADEVRETSVQEAPVQESSVQETPVQESPVLESPAQDSPDKNPEIQDSSKDATKDSAKDAASEFFKAAVQDSPTKSAAELLKESAQESPTDSVTNFVKESSSPEETSKKSDALPVQPVVNSEQQAALAEAEDAHN